MKNLKSLYFNDNNLGFIPLFLGLLSYRIFITNLYFIPIFYRDILFMPTTSYLFYSDFFKLTVADIEYPIFVCLASLLLLQIKRLKLTHFVLIYFVLDFFHNFLILYFFSTSEEIIIITLFNAIKFTIFLMIIALFNQKKINGLITFASALFIGEQIGFWISTIIDHIQYEPVFKLTKIYWFLELDRIINYFISGTVFYFTNKILRANQVEN